MVFMTTHIQEEEEKVIWTKSKRTALFPQENVPKKDHTIAIAQQLQVNWAAGDMGWWNTHIYAGQVMIICL